MNWTIASLLVLFSLAAAVLGQFPESCACPDDCICKLDTGIISCNGQGLRHVPIELNSCSWPGIHTLNLSSNFIREIQEYSFSLLTNLTRLYIYENSIALIDRDAFVGLSSLEFLFLDGNRISSLPYQVFRPLGSLKKLLLYDNFLTTLPFGIFSQQAQLTTLALYSNRLTELKTEWFDDTPKLENLYLHDNEISELLRSPFRSLHYLKVLFLNENLLTSLIGSSFVGLRRLSMLVLSNNQIATISNDVFLSTPQLQQLFLEFNKLTEVNRLVFAPPVYLEQLRIYSNQITRVSDGAFYRLRNLKLLSAYDNQISSITPQTFVGLDSLNELVLHNNLISSVRNKTFTQSPLLQTLWLNSNRISCLESDAFHNLKKCVLLNLGYNQLTHLPDGVFQTTPELLYLLLNSNRLSTIGNQPFKNLTKMIQLALTSNPIEYLAEGCFTGSNKLYYFQFSRDGDTSSFRCDCGTLWLHEWMASRPLLSSVLCGKPDQFAGQDIRTLRTASFGCEAAILTVEVGPNCGNHVVARGSCLQLNCSSRPRGHMTWTRADRRPIRAVAPSCSSASSCGQSASGDGTLVLSNVTPEDSGYYICTASFRNQTATEICHITVAEPPVLHGEPEEVFLTYPGPSARFSLNISGSPTPTVKWYHILPNKAEILVKETGPFSRYLVSDQGSLVILQTQFEDRGKYKAVITNGGGTLNTETELHFIYESPCRSQCRNGGDCRESHYCSCPENYDGRYCENLISGSTLAPPVTSPEVDSPSATEVPVSSIETPHTTTAYDKPTEVPEIDVDKPIYGSGSGSGFGSGLVPDFEIIGSGDADIMSGSGSGLPSRLDNNDGANLVDDEDFDKLGAVGSAKRQRRRSLSPFSTSKSEQRWHVNHRRQRHKFESVVESVTSDRSGNAIAPLPEEHERVGDPIEDLAVHEYKDLKDDRARMLQFER